MFALVAPTPYLALDATFARLLSTDRQRMARAFAATATVVAAPGSGGPWRASEVVLLAALGFFLASLLLSAAFV